MRGGLVHGAIRSGLHVCVDMQRLFGPGMPWCVPWMERVLPAIMLLSGRHAARTVFTRFIPADRATDAAGTWAQVYRKWADMTLENLDPRLLELVPPLPAFVPPARLLDKRVYSPWTTGGLDRMLADTEIDTLIISGAETDMCVLATVLGAVDRGYRVVVVEDGVCGSADETHDAAMTIFRSRFSQQIEIAAAEEILDSWR